MELMGICCKYELKGLGRFCENELMKSGVLKITNVAFVLQMAKLSEYDRLKRFCMFFILSHWKELEETTKFQGLEKEVGLLLLTMIIFCCCFFGGRSLF